jgi:hypothetical protein
MVSYLFLLLVLSIYTVSVCSEYTVDDFISSGLITAQQAAQHIPLSTAVPNNVPLHTYDETASNHSFVISNRKFLLDGKPFLIGSCEIHYWRYRPSLWEERLDQLVAMGCNTITMYFHWAKHQPENNDNFIITPDTDFIKFIELVLERNLYIIARVGPYITAEVDFGKQKQP